jgi:DNA-binding GntR family transcriptional regulator
MIDLNRRFHFEIFRLSPLLVVLEELERLWTIAAPYIAQKYVTVEMRTRTVSEHDGLIASLEPFDRERTAALLETHRMQRAFGG